MEYKYDVFISYSRKDYADDNKNIIPDNAISSIRERLESEGITYWFDQEGIVSSDEFASVLAENIKASRMILFVSSENSNASPWTSREIATASKSQKRIIPIKIDNSDYGISFELYLNTLDFIEYFKNQRLALDKLVKSIKDNKKKLILEEKKEEVFQQMRQMNDNLRKELVKAGTIINKLNSINICNKKCPVCSSKIRIEQKYCDSCGFYFPFLYGIPGFDSRVDEDYLSLMQRIWASLEMPETKKIEVPVVPKPKKEKGVIVVKDVSFKMIPVEGGSFIMGAGNESHKEMVSSYKIGETPVTQALWKAVMGSTPSKFQGDNLPVEQVSWHDCGLFITRLREMTGKNFRLPSEAEWEFAARGGNKSLKTQFSGSNDIETVGWCKVNCSDNENAGKDYGTHAVKTKAPNELRIYDMSGNVWEWCADNFDSYGTNKVCRGGSWDSDAQSCSVSFRNYGGSLRRSPSLGFRLVL